MDTLVILLLFQFAGVALCTIFSYVREVRESRNIYVSDRVARSVDPKSWLLMEEYFQLHQESNLRNIFPDSYKIAMATKRYIELNGLVRLSPKQYQKRLKRILKLVDITGEFGAGTSREFIKS